ncbi:MAG: hypothetical protein FD153_2001 [Rhodospirillaceae bacterium]|nr:MAG: hypothetical protein FD153_2001 [Rhodospirillaceae bacterium]
MFGVKTLFTRTPNAVGQDNRPRDTAPLLPGPRLKKGAWIGQGVAYGIFALTVGVFSAHPSYHYTDGAHGMIKLSLSHSGQRKVACRQRDAEELARLPPNMRVAQACERARWPVRVELVLDEHRVFERTVLPAGLSGDGASSFYATFLVPAGPHTLDVRLVDGNDPGQAIIVTQTIELAPRQVRAIGFDAEERHFFVQ